MADLATRRGNVFEGLFDFRRDFDGIFNRLLTQSAQKNNGALITLVASVPPIEARVDAQDNKYHLRVALPGVEPNEVQITLQGQYLTISGEHKTQQDEKDSAYLEKEFFYERFERTIALPDAVDTEKINAEFSNGVLEITAPLKAGALPKKIEIKSLPKAKATNA
jgi:HSP20 family protein